MTNKFEHYYFGPYEIVKKIGEVAFLLQLPIGAKIHNVYHASLLKKFVLGEDANDNALPTDLTELVNDLNFERGGVVTLADHLQTLSLHPGWPQQL